MALGEDLKNPNSHALSLSNELSYNVITILPMVPLTLIAIGKVSTVALIRVTTLISKIFCFPEI